MGHDVSRQTASSQRATRLPVAVHTSDDGRLQRVVDMAVDCYWEQDAQQRSWQPDNRSAALRSGNAARRVSSVASASPARTC
jgi:hypothetical protein